MCVSVIASSSKTLLASWRKSDAPTLLDTPSINRRHPRIATHPELASFATFFSDSVILLCPRSPPLPSTSSFAWIFLLCLNLLLWSRLQMTRSTFLPTDILSMHDSFQMRGRQSPVGTSCQNLSSRLTWRFLPILRHYKRHPIGTIAGFSPMEHHQPIYTRALAHHHLNRAQVRTAHCAGRRRARQDARNHVGYAQGTQRIKYKFGRRR